MQLIYRKPLYYDIAFQRDIGKEIVFFEKVWRLHGPRAVKRILEPCCGTGFYLVKFPPAGYDITGYDIDDEMLALARKMIAEKLTAGQAGRVTLLKGDMRKLAFEEKFDAAFLTINSLGYIFSDSDIIDHLTCISRSLVDGGTYILELTVACSEIEHERFPFRKWEESRDGISIEGDFEIEAYDTLRKLRTCRMRLDVHDNGHDVKIDDTHQMRLWYFDDLVSMASRAGFDLAAVYDQEGMPVPYKKKPITGEMGPLYYVLRKN